MLAVRVKNDRWQLGGYRKDARLQQKFALRRRRRLSVMDIGAQAVKTFGKWKPVISRLQKKNLYWVSDGSSSEASLMAGNAAENLDGFRYSHTS